MEADAEDSDLYLRRRNPLQHHALPFLVTGYRLSAIGLCSS
jgi:hypothetical protein